MSVETFEVPRRHEIMTYLKTQGLRTGDIVFRQSSTKGPFGIPFSALVSKFSKSEFSHAALLYIEGDEIYVYEVSDRGTLKYRMVDWLDFCVGGRFAIYRYNELTPALETALGEEIENCWDADLSYDFTYADPGKVYCVESVIEVYKTCGVTLIAPTMISDILGRVAFAFFSLGNDIVYRLTGKGFKTDVPVYFVGNKQQGLLSSGKLVCVVPANPFV
jgi:hypothetical protein